MNSKKSDASGAYDSMNSKKSDASSNVFGSTFFSIIAVSNAFPINKRSRPLKETDFTVRKKIV
jgi:hypothetical protein